MTDIPELQERLRDFAERRDWKQFHSPKNLSMALIVEAGELAEHFQWLTQDESFNKIALNEAKYPADLVRGSAKKYNEY